MSEFWLRLEKALVVFFPSTQPEAKGRKLQQKRQGAERGMLELLIFPVIFLLSLFSLSCAKGESSWTQSYPLQTWPSLAERWRESHLQGQSTKPGLGAVTCSRAKAPWGLSFKGSPTILPQGLGHQQLIFELLIPSEVFWALFSSSKNIFTALVLGCFLQCS